MDMLWFILAKYYFGCEINASMKFKHKNKGLRRTVGYIQFIGRVIPQNAAIAYVKAK